MKQSETSQTNDLIMRMKNLQQDHDNNLSEILTVLSTVQICVLFQMSINRPSSPLNSLRRSFILLLDRKITFNSFMIPWTFDLNGLLKHDLTLWLLPVFMTKAQ